MENELKDLELIEDNQNGTLSEVERIEFELRLQEDKELQSLLEDYTLFTEGIKASGRAKLMNEMKQWENEFPKIATPPRKAFSPNRWIMVAATFMILFSAATCWYLLSPKALTGEEVFQAYFDPYTNIADPTFRGENEVDGPLRKAYRLYDSKNYGQSEVELAKLFKQTGEPIHQFYLAMSQMANGKTSEGKKNLQLCLNKLPVLEPQIKWYLALASIKLEQKEEALKWLNQLSKSDTSYAPKADKLLKEIQ